jgi:hypothetical protein
VLQEKSLVDAVDLGELGLSGHLVGRLGRGVECRPLRGELLRVGRVLRRGDVLVLRSREEREERAKVVQRVSQGTKLAERQLEQVLFEEDGLLGLCENSIVGGQSEEYGVLSQNAVAERVERPDVRLYVAVRDEPVDAFFHLGGRFLGEGQGEDCGWL